MSRAATKLASGGETLLSVLALLGVSLLASCGDYYGPQDPRFSSEVNPNKPPPTPSPEPSLVSLDLSGNRCPKFGYVAVTPLEPHVGQTISLLTSAVDPDGDLLSYSWAATNGDIADSTAPLTSYTCTEPGQHGVYVTVADGICEGTSQVVPVNCREVEVTN